MQESVHLNQEKLLDQSEMMQGQGSVQEEVAEGNSKKKFVTIKEVMALLNANETIESVKQKLQIRTDILEAKLANSAVGLNNEGQWEYFGGNQNESLGRNVYSKIFVRPYDKEYIESIKELKSDSRTSHVNETLIDVDYELYRNSLKVKNATDKKSVLFEEGLYEELKLFSKNKSIKMSSLLNTLIKKGLEYYRL
ncbi:hypothetical protein JFL43_20555 [Viridibacillus sp. YIM B01967]|uniref:Uncharacterized protein n=1 Tax=Viridibacillus soli TaxID=2798301 RepID=A0ABS1HCS6_9BACL|nr:hypothetical protein [Viridibacillus soli]MBK3497175.1 hypothetical protein [Viridibacillus soli]